MGSSFVSRLLTLLPIPWTSSFIDDRFSSLIALTPEVILATSPWIDSSNVPKEVFTSSLKSTNRPSTLLSESTINFLYEGTSSPIKPFTVSDNSENSFFLQKKF